MKAISAFDFAVKIDDLQQSKFVEKTYSPELSSNQVLLEIEKFSFTSNNITYGIVGEQLNYWKFFPTESTYGIIPAWGFARAIISKHPDIQVGQRFYGYYPMATHLLVTTKNVSDRGFVDNAEHRQALPPIYNFYSNIEQDPTISPETEELISLFRPLFVTSFLIDHYLAHSDFYKSTQICLTSASSKTAQALAFLLSRRKEEKGLKFKIIGLTSANNVEFVNRLGWYDYSFNYDEISHIDNYQNSIIVDFTGNHDLQFRMQTLLRDKLVYNCLVGIVDWENRKGEKSLPKKGTFFFAPDYARELQKEWGLTKFQENIDLAWLQFSEAIQSAINIKEHAGGKRLQQLYLDMLNGKIDPGCGNIVKLNK